MNRPDSSQSKGNRRNVCAFSTITMQKKHSKITALERIEILVLIHSSYKKILLDFLKMAMYSHFKIVFFLKLSIISKKIMFTAIFTQKNSNKVLGDS